MFIAARRAARRTACLAALSVAVLSASAGAPPESPPQSPPVLAAALPGRTGVPIVVHASFDGQALASTVERIDLTDPQLTRVWGTHLNRVVLAARAAARTGRWALTVTR